MNAVLLELGLVFLSHFCINKWIMHCLTIQLLNFPRYCKKQMTLHEEQMNICILCAHAGVIYVT